MNHHDLEQLADEQVALNAVRSEYRHLRFLDDLTDAPHEGLDAYFPRTASGALRPQRGESYYEADGIHYIGRNNGSMVPVNAEHLEPMPENIWDAEKFSALVEAVERGDNPAVDPGYADFSLEGGEIAAQVRDGNHRTFAPIAAGGDRSWVMLSANTEQDLVERAGDREVDALYRAIRKAQREARAPLFTRPKASKVREGKRAELLEAERRYLEVDASLEDVQRELLRTYGRTERGGGFSMEEQLRRPEVFWRQRLGELSEAERDTYHDGPLGERLRTLYNERMTLGSQLYDLRKAAGLKHGERLDPETGKVVR